MNQSRMTRRGFIGLSGFAAIAVTGLTGCAGDTGGKTSPTVLRSPSTKPSKIVVRTWGDPWESTIRKLVAEPFTKATGIGVEFDLSDFGPMHVKIQQAQQSGSRPPVDVVHTVGFFAEKARAQKLLVPLDPGIVPNLSKLSSTGLPTQGSADGSPFANAYSYTFPMIYDADQIDLSGGMSWGDLVSENYRSSFFAASTFEVLAFPFAKILGVDPSSEEMKKVWDELRALRPSLSGFGQDSDFSNSLRAGQSKMGAFIGGNAIALQQSGMNVKWMVPEEGSSLTGDSLYTPSGVPDDVAYWSQVFINTWLDKDVQSAFCDQMGVIPSNSGSTLAEYMDGDPAFPFTDDQIAKYGIPVPLDVTARNQDDWQGQYVAALQG